MDFVRELALKGVVEIEESAYSNVEIEKILSKKRNVLTDQDIGFLFELINGVITWKLTLDTIIQKYSHTKLKKMSKWVLQILRLGAYQILFLDRVPDSAAVNESVKLAKKYANKSTGFINAILRKISLQDILDLKKEENLPERISVEHSMPLWIVNKWIEEYGIEKAEEICYYSHQKAKPSIRVNTLKTTKEKLIKQLEQEQIETKPGILPDFLIVLKGKNLAGLKSYQEGLFTIQDESAGLAALLLSPQKGETILDCCSAPGGKTTYLAQLMGNEGKIEAWDYYEKRVKMVEENAKRLGISIIHAEVKDATIEEKSEYKFDKILVDAPCMGLGVIRRKPDIKWQKKEEEIEDIKKIQLKILQNIAPKLKKGGTLVYSTCSLCQEENEEIIQQFLQSSPEYEVKLELKLPLQGRQRNFGITLFPDEEKDGFFICKLSRR